jgi:hypothetical protein
MSRGSRPPTVLTCLLVLAFVDIHARVRGMRGALKLARRPPVEGGAGADSELIRATARQVSIAAAFYPRRALCLEQSLALNVLLRRSGVRSDLRIGVHARPFYAHAWVEVDGTPVAEQGDIPLNLTLFPIPGA